MCYSHFGTKIPKSIWKGLNFILTNIIECTKSKQLTKGHSLLMLEQVSTLISPTIARKPPPNTQTHKQYYISTTQIFLIRSRQTHESHAETGLTIASLTLDTARMHTSKSICRRKATVVLHARMNEHTEIDWTRECNMSRLSHCTT